MKNRFWGSGVFEEGMPEYEWLYGKAGNAGFRGFAAGDEIWVVLHAGSPCLDQIWVMFTLLREHFAGGGVGCGGGLIELPFWRGDGPTSFLPVPFLGTRRWRLRFRVGMLKWVLLLWLVFLVTVPLWAWSKVDKVDAEPNGNRFDEQPGTTYFLVGSDSRVGLLEEDRQDNNLGGDVGQRTDTIMLLHIGFGPNLLMSILRDLLVLILGYGTTKVNAAYVFGGFKLLVCTLEDVIGIRIDHYVEIGLGGFVNVVDAVGGIEICPTQDMNDPQANLDIEKGCQEVDGQVALGYARSRKTSSLGDIDCARHQREVVSAVGEEVVSSWSVLNFVRYFWLNAAMPNFFTVSEGTNLLDMGCFVWAMMRVDGETGLTCGVPICDLAVNWDEACSEQLFDFIVQDETGDVLKQLCTFSGLPLR